MVLVLGVVYAYFFSRYDYAYVPLPAPFSLSLEKLNFHPGDQRWKFLGEIVVG